MAGFRYNGVDAIEASLQQLASLPDSARWSILSAGAAVVQRFQQDRLAAEFRRRTGQLVASIHVKKTGSGERMKAQILPTGKRKKASTGKRTYKGRSHGSYQGTNAEVAYILEYGSPRIAASHWMEAANTAAEPEMMQAEADAWDDYLKSINL